MRAMFGTTRWLLPLMLLGACKIDNGIRADTPLDSQIETDVIDSPNDTPPDTDDTDRRDTDRPDTDVTDLDADDDGSLDADDCDDADATVYPGAPEVCDGRDTNCEPADEAQSCSCTTATYGGHTYHMCTVHVDWTAGRGVCALLGADLAIVGDAGENTFLVDAGNAIEPTAAWWIGATDSTTEGAWLDPSGSSLAYSAFCGGEPNNAHGGECSSSSEEDCGVLDWCEGGWNDLPCDCVWTQIGVACEGP